MIKNKINKIMAKPSLIKKIRHFIQYHNAFILIMIFIVGFGSAIFANQEIRENVVGQKIVEQVGKDNSFLLAIDLDNYDLAMKITDILEDDKYYYVHYQHKAIIVENSVWQELIKQDVLRVEKESNRYDDLGLYVAEQLSQVANRWLRVLKTAQEEEQGQGLTQKTEITRYSGLIGRFVDTKEIKIPGYEPVLKDKEKKDKLAVQSSNKSLESGIDNQDKNIPLMEEPAEPELTENEKLKILIEQILLEKYGITPSEVQSTTTTPTSTTSPSDEESPATTTPPTEDSDPDPQEVCDSENLDLCATQNECEDVDGFWYDEICNAELKEEPEEVCDSENLELCSNQDLCEGIGLYWYDEICNTEPEPEPDTPLEVQEANNNTTDDSDTAIIDE